VIDYDRSCIEALAEDQTALWTRVNSAVSLTVNEKRNQLGFDERANGDVILVPVAQVPLGDVTGGVPGDLE